MVTLDDIKNALKDQKLLKGQISMSTLGTLSYFTDIQLLMDEDSFDYYYALDVDKLINSPATRECLTDLANDGWSLNKDKTQIIKYIINFT